jgi:parallel beta-helix repeat protein
MKKAGVIWKFIGSLTGVVIWASVFSTSVNGLAATNYVSSSGGDIFPYTNWVNAATSIQAAIDVAESNGIVIVDDGEYLLTNTISLGNGITLQSRNDAESTTIDGQGSGRCISMTNATLDGFTVEGGMSETFGGGIYAINSTVQNCKVLMNTNTASYGAGIYCQGSVITNCDILENRGIGHMRTIDPEGHEVYSPAFGGGIACENSTIVDCRVEKNHADVGAGIQAMGGSTIRNCFVSLNATSHSFPPPVSGITQEDLAVIQIRDGAILDQSLIIGNACIGISLSDNASVRNCVVSGNSMGGIALMGQGGIVQNCTVVDNNTAWDVLGGIDLDQARGPSPCVLENNIVYNNTGAQVSGGNSNAVIRWNCIQGWTNLVDGNITSDPQLTPSYRLKSTSPCIDAGTSSNAPATDIDGDVRWDHPGHSNIVSIVDLGADEFVDTDSDNMADYWETEVFGSTTNSAGTADDDNDELNDLAEYENSTDPGKADTDNDQMPDGWEVGNALNPLADDAHGDPDSDVLRNLGEYVADTDPQDASSVLSILGLDLQAGGVRLDWKGGQRAWQYLECRSNFTSTADQWTAIFAMPPPTPITNAIIDLGATNTILFYRVRVQR